jgi:hypothetical protein
MAYDLTTADPTVLTHHADDCPAGLREPCSCGPLGFRAVVLDSDGGQPTLGPVVDTEAAARSWREEQHVASAAWRSATMAPTAPPPTSDPGPMRVDDLIDEFLEDVADGHVLDDRGRPLGADALQRLRWALGGHVSAELGSLPVSQLRASHARELADRLARDGQPPERVRPVVIALVGLLRYAAERDLVAGHTAEAFLSVHEMPALERPTRSYSTVPATDPAGGGGVVSDEVIWLILKVVAICFALIALVLVAESV